MSNPAQDEFDGIMLRQLEKPTRHPADVSRFSSGNNSDADTTVVASSAGSRSLATPTGKRGSSLRSSSSKLYGGGHDSSDDDYAYDGGYGYGVAGTRAKSRPFYLPPGNHYDANTGPKGVIADAKAFENERRIGNKRTYVRTEHMVLPKMQRLAIVLPRPSARRQGSDGEDGQDRDDEQEDRQAAALGEDDDDGDDDDGDDDYLRRWRERRASEFRDRKLHRLVSGSGPSGAGRRGRYGSLVPVDASGFLDAVDGGHPETTVVIFVYDESEHSQKFQPPIEDIAAKYADVRFIALHYEEAEMEHAGIPALLAYKGGEQFASLLPLRDEVPLTRFLGVDLEAAMKFRHMI